MSAWERHEGVTCVECPKCAFTFDADHEDMQGGYSCPVCRQAELEEALREIKRRGEKGHGLACAGIASDALAHKEETP